MAKKSKEKDPVEEIRNIQDRERNINMKITADEKLNVAYVKLCKGKVESTVELRPGILFDLDKKGQVIGIEVLSLDQIAPALTENKRKRKSA